MPEKTLRTLNHFALFRFSEDYYRLDGQQKNEFRSKWLSGLSQAAQAVSIYQGYPINSGGDILVWCALEAEDAAAAGTFFKWYACATNPYRNLLQPSEVMWGFTKPSQYTKTRSTQEIDPFAETRKPYLIMYPFVKTIDWYMMSREARQGMMNEHIRIGKGYPEITQLLLYSFGLQDQEFIVVYETEDLNQFSDLVYELRASEARRYTERDTPLFTGLYHPAEETLALWE